MNALIKKEIRLLLPSWTAVLILETLQAWFWKEPDRGIMFGCYVFFFGMIVLAVQSFGREFSLATFQSLLSQPIERSQIWRTKTTVLLIAAGLIFAAYLASWELRLHYALTDNHPIWHVNAAIIQHDFSTGMWVSGVMLLIALTGGWWTTLLLRQTTAAFWITCLAPAALLVMIALVMSTFFHSASDAVVFTVLYGAAALYVASAFWFARRLFFRAQDVTWTGGTIALPEMRGLARFKLGSGTRRLWRPRAALLVKEFQLHQSQFVVAGVLALLHLGVLATRKLANFQRNSALEFVLEIFWGLWLVLPMLVGAAAVAEERKLGTLAGQLCLPVRRRTQFVTKAGVVLLLTLLFGVAMPLLLEGTRILPNVNSNLGPITAMYSWPATTDWLSRLSTTQVFFWNCLGVIVGHLPLLTLMGIATTIGLISFYASTLTRNTLQALAPAVLGLLVTYFLLFMAARPDVMAFNFGIHLPWQGDLVYLIGVPVLAITVVALAYGNFKRVFIGGLAWLRNALVLLAMLGLVAVTTTAVYHRAWEKLTPFEPAHGVARLSWENPPVMQDQWNSFSVRLPDGRIWADDYALNTSAPNPLALLLGNFRLTSLGGGHFYEGSNWTTVVGSPWRELVGLKTDGTLWVSATPAHRERQAGGGWQMAKAGDFVRVGSGTNWNSLVWHGLNVLLVKDDGTLWRWGVTNWNSKLHEWPGLAAFTPQRLGTETNWAQVFMAGFQCLRKTDGSVWTLWNDGHHSESIRVAPGFSVYRAAYLEKGRWRSTTTLRSGLQNQLGIRDDGTFRLRADQKLNQESRYYEWTAVDLQFGSGTNWLAVAGRGQKIVTLKDNGTLWLWNFHHDDWRGADAGGDEREMLAVKPVRLGSHSDWIAITSTDGGIVSLAADGSLWYWPLERSEDFRQQYNTGNGDGTYFVPLLDMSRKPQLLGNIFG